MGIARVEVNIPENDRKLLRQLAANLRAGGLVADETRTAMRSVISPYAGMNLKELIEAMPEGELDLERSKDTGRDIEF